MIIKLITFVLLSFNFLIGKDYAFPLEEGERQMGIIQPRIYGMKNNIEISTHPLLFFIKPNIKVKKFQREIYGYGLAFRYSFDYPTLLLRLLQRDGIGGLFADDPNISEIPHLAVMQQEWLVTKIISKYTLTGKIGLSISTVAIPGLDNLDSRHLIDYDLVYPRLAIHHYGIGANMGLDWDYLHSDKISLKGDLDLLFLPEEHVFVEHKFLLHYHFSEKYTLTSGYKFSYGYYPFNKENGLWNLFPMFDLSWHWGK